MCLRSVQPAIRNGGSCVQEACDQVNDDMLQDGGGDGMPAHEAELWGAALAGNAQKVRHMLRHYNLPAEMMHPETGSTLLLDVAAVRTTDSMQDRRLCEVMAALVRARGSLRRRLFPANNTALHLLAAQPYHCRVHHRVLFVLDKVGHDPSPTSVLRMRNADGDTPEQVAAQFRPDLRALLAIWREFNLREAALYARCGVR